MTLATLRIRALVLALRLPDAVIRPLVRVPGRIDGQPLDLRTRWFLTLLQVDRVAHHTLPVAQQRAEIDLVERSTAAPVRPVRITPSSLPLPGRELGLRVYTPPEVRVRPGLLYLHGGGWVTGCAEGYDALCARLALDADCVVLSLDYRLAPEHPWPAAIDDAEQAFVAIRSAAETWGVDPDRLAVGGDSAGGNLAAIVANQLGSAAVGALLLYPGVDLGGEAPSMTLFAEGFFLTRAHIRWFEDQYVPRTHREDPRVSPLHAAVLGRVPTVVVTAGLDPLRDAGRAYAARLAAEGVPVDLLEVPGLVHGFLTLDGVLPAADAANAAVAERLRALLHPV